MDKSKVRDCNKNSTSAYDIKSVEFKIKYKELT